MPGSALKRILWYVVSACVFRSYMLPFSGLKRHILNIFGAKIAKGVVIKPGVNIKYPWYLEIGENTWIGEGAWIDNLDHVRIGANCCISQGVMLLCGNHNYAKRSFDLMIKPIVLEEGVWLGAQSRVAPGVVCGSHAVLSYGSIAYQNLEAYTIYAGHPAQKVKKRQIEE